MSHSGDGAGVAQSSPAMPPMPSPFNIPPSLSCLTGPAPGLTRTRRPRVCSARRTGAGPRVGLGHAEGTRHDGP